MSHRVRFLPDDKVYEVEENSKILAVALKNKVPIQYGCASCRCGTCGISVSGGKLSPMRDNERQLLARMGLSLDGTVRLACQARAVEGEVVVDLEFQGTYTADQGEDFPE